MPSFYESFGMVALEAMACGTPVIASRVGGLAYLVQEGKTGFFVPSQDPRALAEKLQLLFNDQALRIRLGKQAAAYAQDFKWELITRRVMEAYTSLLGDH